MRRRSFVTGIGGLIALGTATTLRPHNHGHPYTPYFQKLNFSLKQQGAGIPSCIVDVEALQRNIQRIKASLVRGRPLRIVAKSLASPQLLQIIMHHLPTQRLMVFHQPQIGQLRAFFPQSDLLLGKPMPIEAVAHYYQQQPPSTNIHDDPPISWLIDTYERTMQYQNLAKQLNRDLWISLELDVGLHRGGLQFPYQLNPILTLLNSEKSRLHLKGMMGYDAQVGKLPAWIESTTTSMHHSQNIYKGFQEQLSALTPKHLAAPLIMNGAGSPTFRLHTTDSPLNEVAVGSAFVKASDFDLDLLTDLEPACWIATPVLKSLAGLHLPGPDLISQIWSLWDANRNHTYFIYGGGWRAKPVSPQGLQLNTLYGVSTNQCMYNASARTRLNVDDYLFLRPTQSEQVLQEFGTILAWHSSTAHFEKWDVLS